MTIKKSTYFKAPYRHDEGFRNKRSFPKKPVLFHLTKGTSEEGKYISIKCNMNANLKASEKIYNTENVPGITFQNYHINVLTWRNFNVRYV